jgi:4-hydroxybenzoate polyprenyltransferase
VGLLAGITAGLAALLGGPAPIAHALLAGALVLALRLLDDLLDWHYDREHHPHRALAALDAHRRDRLLVLTLVALAALLVCHARYFSSAAGAFSYGALLALIYASRLSRRVREVLLLAKYPALVLAGALEPGEALLPALALYGALLGLNAWELARHEPERGPD